MELHLVQMAIARGKPELNRAKVQALTAPIKPAKGGPQASAALIVLPELFSTGYLDESALPGGSAANDLAKVARDDRAFLSALAQRTQAWVAGTTTEAGATGAGGNGGYRNLSLHYAPDGSERASYRKVHPFSYGGEDRLFDPGREIVTFDLEGWVVQPTICYDLRFPELFRAGSARGVHLIVSQSNWPQARQEHWRTLLRARAIENQAYVAGVNCTGSQDALAFAGGSVVFSPKGEVVAEAAADEGVLRAKIDLDECKQWRKHFPALRDRLPWDFYSA